MTLRYACARCRRIITDWRASVLPDGRIELQGRCHGDVFTIRQILDLKGVAFNDGSPLDLETRDPDEYLRLAKSGGEAAGGSGR